MLMHSLQEDLPQFIASLKTIRPNLLLIGAMTQCLPGAIACAQTAKEMLGDKVCIVLGGRHVTESMYLSADNVVTHHSSSPLKLMAQGQIPTCFDLVVAGESEHLIARLGYIVGALEQIGVSPSNASKHLEGMAEVPGKWILGWQEGGEMFALPGQGPTVDRNCLPVPCEMFGISASFEVFGGRLTAHVYSDTSCGCVYKGLSPIFSFPPTKKQHLGC
jgi:hypothetical protein